MKHTHARPHQLCKLAQGIEVEAHLPDSIVCRWPLVQCKTSYNDQGMQQQQLRLTHES